MKYWIFQSNQVLGPYDPDDLSKHSAFGAESLVCPEGRRGTSMGDWQRAGMVPDLSVALVRASRSQGSQGSVATLAGLPPEPTLKDLAILGSLQEKMAMMEDVVLQLQEGLKAKDAELKSLQQELAGKERQSSVMKSAMEHEAADLKQKTEERRREAEDLQAQTNEFRLKMAELEERVGAVNRLSETIDRAVEAEKSVAHDVEAQGDMLSGLTKEIETLRAQLTERLSSAAPASPPTYPEPAIFPEPSPFQTSAPATPAMDMKIEMPSEPARADDTLTMQAPSPLPAFGGGSMPSFGSGAPDAAMTMPMDPMATPSFEPSAASRPEPEPAAVPAAAAPAPAGRKKALVFGALFGLVVLGAFVFVSGGLGKKKVAAPANVTEAAPPPMPMPSAEPAPAPAPAIDPREAAIEAAKQWMLPNGRSLGQVLETLSPPIGNLSPWMAEPLTNDRVSVNYFAHGGASGAPTVAYEFEVDLAAKTVAGRNPAAKAVISGKAAAPPAPPKAKPVKLKPRTKASKAPNAPKAPKAAAKEDLDSLLGADSAAAMPGVPAAANTPEDGLSAPGEDAAPKPAKPATAKRAAKASAKSVPADSGEKAADETLLDDILKE
ncbi:MAG: hypothetical protein ACHQ2Z_09230 [Elusimicrobiota bacterium]